MGPGQFECRPYPLDAPLGSHIDQEDLTWLWRRLMCKKAEGPPESSCCQLLCSGPKPPVKQPPAALLAKHGLAVVLYFKFLVSRGTSRHDCMLCLPSSVHDSHAVFLRAMVSAEVHGGAAGGHGGPGPPSSHLLHPGQRIRPCHTHRHDEAGRACR